MSFCRSLMLSEALSKVTVSMLVTGASPS
jgi:hypothetical protein